MASSVNVDEIIIDFVRENHCLYDKRNVDFKNINKKKELWKKISETLKTLYNVNIPGKFFVFLNYYIIYFEKHCNMQLFL